MRSKNASLVGAILYAFSGFQVYNIFFNHFQDVTAFFPLMLIAMEEKHKQQPQGIFCTYCCTYGFYKLLLLYRTSRISGNILSFQNEMSGFPHIMEKILVITSRSSCRYNDSLSSSVAYCCSYYRKLSCK